MQALEKGRGKAAGWIEGKGGEAAEAQFSSLNSQISTFYLSIYSKLIEYT
jgi:hypothetical protein